jgi:excisionase family DNA binding protein
MEVLTCKPLDAARALGIGKTKVYELIGAGKLKTIKIGRSTLIKTDSIRLFVDEAA